MSTAFSTALRNTRLSGIIALFDAGSVGAKCKIYDGTRPATGGTATTLLVTGTYATTSFPTPSTGAVTANTMTDGTGVAAGTPTWFRITDSDDNFVMDGDVVGSGDGVVIDKATIAVSDEVAFTHVMTEGNI